MTRVMHPRPNPIVAAMYTLRDLDADVIIVHGPAGCGFVASRLLEEAGVHVVTTAMGEDDLIFGAEDALVDILREVDERFSPSLVGIVGTCASMIIGENLEAAIDAAGIPATVLAVETHGCIGPNTEGAVKVMEAAVNAGIMAADEGDRQVRMLRAATSMEARVGMASKEYLEPSRGTTKLAVARRVVDTLSTGGRVAVVMNAKKELAYRFADVMLAVHEASQMLGGEVDLVANLDPGIGLPRIRGYARDVLRDLEDAGVPVDFMTGGLDEYPVAGEVAASHLEDGAYDLRVIVGLPHAVPGIGVDDVLVTDQPRQLANLIAQGHRYAVGEISSHSAIMAATGIVATETGDTIRELAVSMVDANGKGEART